MYAVMCEGNDIRSQFVPKFPTLYYALRYARIQRRNTNAPKGYWGIQRIDGGTFHGI
jgi:hypothetical protein